MARHDLIAPTGAVQAAEAGRRRRAAGFAILSAGALLAVLGVSAMSGGERPAAMEPSGVNAMGAVHEAQSAAQGAVANVATFLAAVKAQKEAPSRSDAHALDWNWAPELRRDKSISNWVGSDWVKPLVGDREIKQIAPPRFGAAHDRLAAAKSSKGLASRVMSGSPAEQIPPMPSLPPLHYFIGKAGHSDWNTRDAIKLAKHSVDFVQKAVKAHAHTPKAAPLSMPAARAQHVAADSAAANADATAEVAAKPKAAAPAASPKPEAKKEDMVPAMVLAKEKALQVQIAQLQSDLNKEKST